MAIGFLLLLDNWFVIGRLSPFDPDLLYGLYGFMNSCRSPNYENGLLFKL